MALSPSRAADYRQCPLLYRFKAVDRLQEPHSEAQVRGLIVHNVLESLFTMPPSERTRAAADALISSAIEALVSDRPDVAELAASEDVTGRLPALLDAYFALEDPSRYPDTITEQRIEVTLDDVPLRGYIDRVDTAPDGAVRLSDYKTGKAPSEAWEHKALFQLKLYGLAWWLLHGTVPSALRLLYLNGAKTLTVQTSEAELERFSRILTAMWAAILKAGATGDFRPKTSKLCSWCSFKPLCPEWGGTPPPYPGWPGGAS